MVSLSLITWLSMGYRLGGAVVITDKSRAAIRLNCKVRGMGVAVKVRTSTLSLRVLSLSFTATPNFCSSSTISSPKSLNCTDLLTNWWVPIIISKAPVLNCSSVSRFCLAVLKRFKYPTVTGNAFKRSPKVFACWKAKMVVGTKTATCFPLSTALNAARMATSVLPKPTSPQTKRSMGRSLSISAFMAAVDVIWSGVSS